MKKVLMIILCIALAVGCLATLAACDDHQWEVVGYNEYAHNLLCADCGYSKSETHQPDENGLCTVCGYVEHQHDWQISSYNEDNHTFRCLKCDVERVRKHDFDKLGACADCGYAKPVEKPTQPTEPIEPNEPTDREKIKVYFMKPLEYTSIDLEYTSGEGDDLFVFNPTLGYWATHKAVDLGAPDGTEVVAMFDGVVVKVDEDVERGHYVIIDHGDGVLATYASLNNLQVIEGQQVQRGTVIGVISTSAGYECENGAHLHLEVYKDNVVVDPMPYVKGEIYREIEID